MHWRLGDRYRAIFSGTPNVVASSSNDTLAMRIPRRLHQMWLAQEGTPDAPPTRYDGYRESWTRHHPEWHYDLWNNARVAELIRTDPEFGEPVRRFFEETIERHIERCDFARYLVLYARGGVYVDMDFECFQPCESAVRGKDIAFAREPPSHELANTISKPWLWGVPVISNGFIACQPRHPFIRAVLEHIMRNYSVRLPVVQCTGPVMLGMLAAQRRDLVSSNAYVDSWAIIPWDYKGKEQRLLRRNPHLWQHVVCGTRWNEGSGWKDSARINRTAISAPSSASPWLIPSLQTSSSSSTLPEVGTAFVSA